MNTQLLQQGLQDTPEALGNEDSQLCSSHAFEANLNSSILTFEWQTGDDDSDSLMWQGIPDDGLGLPQNALPATFSAWVEMLHPDDRDAVLNAIEMHLVSDEPYSIECRACSPDGRTLYWIHSGQATRNGNGDPIAFVGTLHSLIPHTNGIYHSTPERTPDQIERLVSLIVEEELPSLGLNDETGVSVEEEQSSVTTDEAQLATEEDEPEVKPSMLAKEVTASIDEAFPSMIEDTNGTERSKLEMGGETAPAAEAPVSLLTENVSLGSAAREGVQSAPVERVVDEQARAQSLLRAAAHLNARLDLDEVCGAICEEAARTIGAPSAVMLFNKARDAFVPSAVRGMPVDYEKRYIPTMRSIYDGHVAEMGTLFLFTDAQATPDLPNHQLYQEVNMRTIGIASLIRDGEVLGLLKVYSFGEPRSFTPNELALLQGLADIAAQAIANARLLADAERRMANIGALREIDKAILGSSDVNLALGVVLDQVVSRLGADSSAALLLDPHTRTLRYAVGRGFRTSTPRRTDWQLGEGLAGRVALERRVIYVPDLSCPELIAADSTAPDLKLPRVGVPQYDADLDSDAHHSGNGASRLRRTGIPLNEGFVSYHGVPLVANGQVKGVLEVWHRTPLQLDEEDLEFLETLAGQAAIAVDNAMLFRDLQRSNDELTLAYDSTLKGWSGALDLRDKETEGHSERVTRETLRLAREMGLSNAELVHVRRGALLHDIGKMGVPDAILLKPGPLTDEEWLVMKKHPTYAFELLSRIEYLRPALDIPYAHHEKWDGSGYPRGLSGEQIPLYARMFAVVDVWDALCSDRPYRQGWPLARVLNHIRDGSGTHFDPAVVEAFLRLHEHEPEGEHDLEPAITSAPPPEPPPSLSWPKRLFQLILGVQPA